MSTFLVASKHHLQTWLNSIITLSKEKDQKSTSVGRTLTIAEKKREMVARCLAMIEGMDNQGDDIQNFMALARILRTCENEVRTYTRSQGCKPGITETGFCAASQMLGSFYSTLTTSGLLDVSDRADPLNSLRHHAVWYFTNHIAGSYRTQSAYNQLLSGVAFMVGCGVQDRERELLIIAMLEQCRDTYATYDARLATTPSLQHEYDLLKRTDMRTHLERLCLENKKIIENKGIWAVFFESCVSSGPASSQSAANPEDMRTIEQLVQAISHDMQQSLSAQSPMSSSSGQAPEPSAANSSYSAS